MQTDLNIKMFCCIWAVFYSLLGHDVGYFCISVSEEADAFIFSISSTLKMEEAGVGTSHSAKQAIFIRCRL
jgi:hypothetical protein